MPDKDTKRWGLDGVGASGRSVPSPRATTASSAECPAKREFQGHPREDRGGPCEAWQAGHQNTLRLPSPVRSEATGVPHRRQGRPALPYTQVRSRLRGSGEFEEVAVFKGMEEAQFTHYLFRLRAGR